MVALRLPDGSIKSFPGAVSGAEVAQSIGPGLAKAALAMKLDGTLLDLKTTIEKDAAIEIVTAKSPAALELLRHDAAHVLAEAVQELYPGTQITFGPSTENGFYYDFFAQGAVHSGRFREDRSEDAARSSIATSRSPARSGRATRPCAGSRSTASRSRRSGSTRSRRTRRSPIYRQGQWLDMCTGPHLPSTGKLGKAFKLMKVAGAYWRGDRRTRSCSASTAPCGRPRRSSRRISPSSKKRRSATIARSARR